MIRSFAPSHHQVLSPFSFGHIWTLHRGPSWQHLEPSRCRNCFYLCSQHNRKHSMLGETRPCGTGETEWFLYFCFLISPCSGRMPCFAWTGYDRKAVPYLDNSDVVWQEPLAVDMWGDGGWWYTFFKVHQGLHMSTRTKNACWALCQPFCMSFSNLLRTFASSGGCFWSSNAMKIQIHDIIYYIYIYIYIILYI